MNSIGGGISSAFVNLGKVGRLSTYAGWRSTIGVEERADIGSDNCHVRLYICPHSLREVKGLQLVPAVPEKAHEDGTVRSAVPAKLILKAGKTARIYVNAVFDPPQRGGYVQVSPSPGLLVAARVKTPAWFIPPGSGWGEQPFFDIEAIDDIDIYHLGVVAYAVALA